ncbi:monosaccharide ABC transporter ATP-binding protein, CUT2 family [Jannaschia faecimaris]|uniref:Monosaccharide ABC transporter ATP-binding protein, CUT2 family n=1 Tax=Jannaschia faecimaris TaxID=1244108 RepID=A0A1H3SUP2_9RHOB|nr:sugar ABC transporter ATP-binding protein [Jannaschia faecimaris]SDZ41245.1 monosaccharide ABC transporter ATP-binding protein, CUT2 family [Jannaschia faecimaris]
MSIKTESPPLVTLEAVTKRYAAITALDGVDLTIRAGEAVCLAGENGSGKSTLIKVLVGVERPSAGRVLFDGVPQIRLTPTEATAAGVQVIFQDFSLFPNLTVAENIAMTAERATGARLVHTARARARAAEVLARVGVSLDLDARIERLPVAHKQLVAICRALAADARLIIMDEPTTALTEREVDRLLELIRKLKSDGVAVLFVSHKLAEVLEVCETVVVLRNGEKVAEGPATDFDAASLTRAMTGRDVASAPPAPLGPAAPPLLQVEGLGRAGAFENVSVDLRAGEVLGVAGLLGSGRTTLAKALFGLARPDRGTIMLDGIDIPLGDPIAAAAAGIGYVPEDRLTEGLFLEQSIAHNIAVGRFDAHAPNGVLNLQTLWAEAADWLKRLSVKAPDPTAPVRSLSGGNQQRVVLARWMARQPRVLILNGPSVGVDVGSKAEIHGIIADLAGRGLGVIVISDDLPELLATCHRILVMKDGLITEEVTGGSGVTEADLSHRLAS